MAGIALNQIGFENLAVSTAAVALSGVSGKLPAHIRIHVGNNPIRWRADGTNPTATVGEFVDAGGYIEFMDPGGDYRGIIAKARFIRDTTAAGNASLGVSYYD